MKRFLFVAVVVVVLLLVFRRNLMAAPRNFFPELLAADLSQELLDRLNATRAIAGVPIYVTSHLRPGDTGSTHGLGEGVDISDNLAGGTIASPWRSKVLSAAQRAGFTRIGIYDRHIHLDVGKAPRFPQDVVWTGISE